MLVRRDVNDRTWGVVSEHHGGYAIKELSLRLLRADPFPRHRHPPRLEVAHERRHA
jgi:hypothetical protein